MRRLLVSITGVLLLGIGVYVWVLPSSFRALLGPVEPAPPKLAQGPRLTRPLPEGDELWIGEEGADADGYPRRHVDQVALVSLVRARKFERAARFMERVQAAFEADFHKEFWPNEAVAAFGSADPELGVLLDSWTEETPSLWAAHAARGAHYKALAWSRRGTQYRNDTTQGEFAGMRESARTAIESYERALALRPGLVIADAELILLAGQTGQTRHEKRAYLEHAVQTCPECLTARLSLLIMLKPIWGGSVELVEQAGTDLSAGPHKNTRLAALRAFADAVRCDVARRSKQPAEGLPDCDRAVSAAPQLPEVRLIRAATLEALTRYEDALVDLDAALEQAPQRTDTLSRRTWYLRRAKRYEQATSELMTLRLLDPVEASYLTDAQDLIRDLTYAGHQARLKGELDRANQLFALALQLDPEHADVKARKQEAEQRQVKAEAGSSQIALLTERLASSPDDFELRRQLDGLYLGAGNLPPIVAMWTTFLASHPEHAGAYFERAGTYRHLGDMKQALADAQRACQLGLQAACAVLPRGGATPR